jgi:hypothetical protein
MSVVRGFGFCPWGPVARGSDRVDQERDAAPDSGGYQAFALQDGEWQRPGWFPEAMSYLAWMDTETQAPAA